MFKAKLNKSAGIVLAMLAGLSAFPALSDDSIATKDLEIGTKPLYVGNSELPHAHNADSEQGSHHVH